MNQEDFLNCLRSLWNIDGWQLPELYPDRQASFMKDPAQYFMRCSDDDASAIWREVEKRQRPAKSAHGPPFKEGDLVVQIGNEHFGVLRVVDCEWHDRTNPGVPHYWLVTAAATDISDPSDYAPGTTGIVSAAVSHADARHFRLAAESGP